MLHLVGSANLVDRKVSSIVIHDPWTPPSPVEGALLLGVGVGRGSLDSLNLLEELASRRYCGVVVKRHGATVDVMARAAGEWGITLLVVDDDL